jgi:hypothetical protein
MEPSSWSETIVDYLEHVGVVGSILPRGASEATDRYQPSRVFAHYVWSGDLSAGTRITFRTRAPDDRDDVDINESGWTISSRPVNDDWGGQWEDITIHMAPGPPTDRSEEFYAPGRFRIRVSMSLWMKQLSDVGFS